MGCAEQIEGLSLGRGGEATRSNSPAVSVRTRRVLRVRVARWSSRPEKLRAGRSVVVGGRGWLVGWLASARSARPAPAPGRPPVRDLRRGGDELPLGLPQRGLTGDRTQPSLVAKSPGSDQSGPWWPPGFSQRGGRHHAVLGPGKNDPHIREAGTAATEREGCFSPWMGAGTRSTLHGCVARRCSTCRRWMTWGSSTTKTERSGRSWSSAAMIPSL